MPNRAILGCASASLLQALAAFALGCGCGSPQAPAPDDPSSSTAPATSASAAAEAPEAPPPEEATPVRAQYDLASHAARAEVREGAVLVVDFGAPGAAKYTIGGFRTGTVDGELEGTTVLFVKGRTGRVALPSDQPGPLTLVLRARTLRPGDLRVYVDEDQLSIEQTEDTDGFALYRIELPEGLTAGEHELLLRTPATAAVRGVGDVGAAIDWLRLGPASGRVATSAPASLASIAPTAAVPTLEIPAGHALGFAMKVRPGARLRALARKDGTFKVVAHRDGHGPRELASIRSPGTLDVDLAELEGEIVRLDLVTDAHDVELLGPAVVVPAEEAAAAPRRPKNVLLYVIDTLRADKLAPYNEDTRVQTPGLLSFLTGATTLGQARSQENWTKPSIATLLSSLLPWQHTATGGDSVVPASVELLPEILKGHDFFTGSFIANGYVSDRFGFGQGWDSYRNYIREGRRTGAEYVAADAIAWLDHRPADKPFFLYVHTIDPHVPYRPPDEFLRLYGDPAYRGPVNFRRDALMLEHIKSGKVRLAERDREHLSALYDGEISYHDVHFAAILGALERRGFADDTLVIVTSDHGEEFWDHGSVGHGHSVYDELLHVPLFVRHPGIAERIARLDEPVGLVDVVPTILDALGLEIPEDLSGRSFLPRLLGDHPAMPPSVISGFMENWRTVVIDGLKLQQRPYGRQALFDLMVDPGEENDVSASRPLALRYARGVLGLRLAATPADGSADTTSRRRRAPAHQAESTEIDAETAAQLRALGYIQ
jgi:arylsulfatase A-like enzyme